MVGLAKSTFPSIQILAPKTPIIPNSATVTPPLTPAGVAAMTGKNLDKQIGDALIADGAATTLAGLGGGSGTTTYAENIGVMAASRVYSTLAYIVAGVGAILLALSPKFGAVLAATAFTCPMFSAISTKTTGRNNYIC